MPRVKPVCQRFEASTETYRGNHGGGFFALNRTANVPNETHSDTHIVEHGYAVDFVPWMFFWTIEPAIAFGRAARMSPDCSRYGVFRAALERQHCPEHHADEIALYVAGPNLDRRDDEVEILKRFVQSVKEHPWSSHWHEPVGFITDYNNGEPAKTSTPSLPL